MTEIQFLIDLLLKEPMTKELHDKLLQRIGSLEMAKAGTPKFEPWPYGSGIPIGPGQVTIPYIGIPAPPYNPPYTITCTGPLAGGLDLNAGTGELKAE